MYIKEPMAKNRGFRIDPVVFNIMTYSGEMIYTIAVKQTNELKTVLLFKIPKIPIMAIHIYNQSSTGSVQRDPLTPGRWLPSNTPGKRY